MNAHNPYSKLLNLLRSKERFLITTHTNPDHDGIGAEIGLDHMLRSLGKESIIVNPDGLSESRRYLDPSGRIRPVNRIGGDPGIGNRMIVGVDTSELRRIEHVSGLISDGNLIFIDHHDTTNADGRTIFQYSSIGSSCEIIYELIELAGVPIPVDVANALYTGIIADTGSFRYGKTTPRTHEIAARLLAAGVSPQMMGELLYSSSPVERLYARRELYSTMKVLEEERIVYFTLLPATLQRIGISYDNLAGIVNEPLEAKNISCSVLFYQKEPGVTKLSIRSKSGINMLPAASRYGGGGHKNACGATISLDLEAAIREFIPWAVDCVKNSL